MNTFEHLKIWNKAMELTELTYKMAAKLPAEEKYNLINQVKRCSLSIPSNIAEGAGRNSNKEFKHFLSIANGSTYELQTQLLLIVALDLTEKEKIQPLIDRCVEIQKMNFGLQKSL